MAIGIRCHLLGREQVALLELEFVMRIGECRSTGETTSNRSCMNEAPL